MCLTYRDVVQQRVPGDVQDRCSGQSRAFGAGVLSTRARHLAYRVADTNPNGFRCRRSSTALAMRLEAVTV